MSRKTVIWGGVALVALLVLGAAGAYGSLLLYRQYNARKNFAMAEDAAAKGDWSKAKTYYSYYIHRNKDDLDTLAKYADVCLKITANRQGALSAAGGAYFQIAREKREDTAARDRVLKFYFDHEMWGDLEYASGFFDREGVDPEMAYYRAVALDRVGRTTDAINAYRKLIAGGSRHMDVYGGLARLLLQQGFEEQGRAVFTDAMKQFPEDARLHLENARFLRAARDTAGADQALTLALQYGPDDPEILTESAASSLDKQEWDTAFAQASTAIEKDPASPEARLALAFACNGKEENEKSLEILAASDAYQQADNPQLLVSLIELQLVLKKLDDAKATIARFTEMFPGNTGMAEYFAARELLAQEKAEEAAAKFARLTQSNPGLVQAQYFHAVALLAAGKADDAKTVLESYRAAQPKDGRAQALWDMVFGPKPSGPEAEAAARSALNAPDTTASALIQAVQPVMTTQLQNPAPERDTLIQEILAKAIAREMASPQAYLTLTGYLLDADMPDKARLTIDQAKAAGIAQKDLALLEGAVLIAEEKAPDALALCQQAIDNGEVPRADAIRWAALFASAKRMDDALGVLAAAGQKLGAEDAFALDIEKIGLIAQFDTLDKAGEAANALAASAPREKRTEANNARVDIARAFMARNTPEDSQKAEDTLAAVEKDDPAHPAALLTRAQVLFSGENPDLAKVEAIASQVLAANPEDTAALQLLSAVSARRGRLDMALDYIQKASKLKDDDVAILLALCEAQMRMRLYTEAQTSAQNVLNVSPTDPRALELLGYAYLGSDQVAQARQVVARVEAIQTEDPRKAQILEGLRGAIENQSASPADAEARLKTQFDAEPDNLPVAVNLARAIATQGRLPEGAGILQAIAQRRATDPEAWSALGELYMGSSTQANLMDASSAFQKALLAMEEYTPALLGMLEVQARLNNVGAALGLCDRYLRLVPNNADVLYLKTTLLAQASGRAEDIIAAASKGIEAADQPRFYELRGMAYLQKKDYPNALKDLQRIKESSATTAPLELALGEAYLGAGEKEMAQQYCDNATRRKAAGEAVDTARLDALTKALTENLAGEN